MPTYDYRCENCKHEFEIYQSMKDEKLTVCPNCGKETLKRLIGSGSGLIFKGSGFYLTDYKNKSSEPSESKPLSSDSKKSEPAPSTAPAPAAGDTVKSETKKSESTSSKQSGKKESKSSTEEK